MRYFLSGGVKSPVVIRGLSILCGLFFPVPAEDGRACLFNYLFFFRYLVLYGRFLRG